jgi:GNAT superfamily N-acetyltransferase
VIAATDSTLDQRLSSELEAFNFAAMPGPAAAELTGIGLTWVRDDQRGSGVGAELLKNFERSAADRGARRIFVTSYTFQAPGFYEKHGYVGIFRWDGVPVEGHADVHFRKDL